jgi:hypothetical protein
MFQASADFEGGGGNRISAVQNIVLHVSAVASEEVRLNSVALVLSPFQHTAQ